MTYYEEFGIPATASAEQIRHSYKNLVRLLHPDQCADAEVKRLAELQMRRLNQVLAVLTNLEERRRYDAAINPPPLAPRRYAKPRIAPRRPSVWRRPWLIGLLAWLPPVAGLALFGAALLYYESGANSIGTVARASLESAGTPASVADTAAEDSGALPAAPTDSSPDTALLDPLRASEAELALLRSEQQKIHAQLDASRRAASQDETFPASPAMPAQSTPELRQALSLMPAGSDQPAPRSLGFVGNWYYAPSALRAVPTGVNAPAHIELHISESGGRLRGRYLARYHLTDRAIDPELAFQFEGPTSASAAPFPWTGSGGSSGKITLRRLSADQLRVTWTGDGPSAISPPVSGAALLIRQQESRN